MAKKQESVRDAGVMLVIKNGLILVVSRGLGSNKWALIGGKAEPGETPQQAAIRETEEESGIKVTKCEKIYSRVEPNQNEDGLDFYSTVFYATSWSGEPRSSHEGEVKWAEASLITSDETGAFQQYNKNALYLFSKQFPKVLVK